MSSLRDANVLTKSESITFDFFSVMINGEGLINLGQPGGGTLERDNGHGVP